MPFGGAEPKSDAVAPWDAAAPVTIPGTGLRIGGYIDRLDIAADGHHALVRDYKTGRMPKDDIVLDHGRELQRCLYAFAVKSLLGDEVSISASLLYLREERDVRLDDADATLVALTGYPATRGNRISQASRSGVMALTCTVLRGGCGGATTGRAVKSKGMPSTSAYSTGNTPSSFSS